ncbi:MAG: sodium-dependent bicarbonate transport family permease [Pseudomonadales bacterium]|nr:sodium-dependent bicarbonate transport family permease [Pseudomonadales bacterium]
MELDIVIAFFMMGVIARLLRSNIQFPEALYQTLTLFLMIAIGLKGGIALASHSSASLLPQSLAVIVFGLMLPLLAFPVLFYIGHMNRADSASIAAHYGSVSVGTYAVAVALLESQNIAYEPYFPLFVVLLEMPAIAVGIALANGKQKSIDKRKLLHEVFCNQGMVLMVGALIIGYWAGDRAESIAPLFKDLFHGALALFLLEMGMVAASRVSQLKEMGSFIIAFGVAMPLVGGIIGGLLGAGLGFSTGGTILLSVLGASASYIAVPAAMRVAVPEANPSLSITSSLGVTFPFNVLVGIPCYALYSQWLTN